MNSCVKSSSEKRYALDLTLENDKGYTNVHTYQAMSSEDFRAWFLVLEGKELTPVGLNLNSLLI